MVASATLKYARMSAQKVRLVADQIRNKSVANAVNILAFSNKKAAKIVKKLLESAIANAENNNGLDVDLLKIDKIFTDIYWYPAGIPPELRDDPSMINALEIVADNSLLSGEFSIDLHKRNIMEREDGTVVITDPYA